MCNSDRRHFLQMSLTLGALSAIGCAGAALAAETDKPKVYVCPPCGCGADSKDFPAPGTCPECGMTLIEKPPAAPKPGAVGALGPAPRSEIRLADARRTAPRRARTDGWLAT